MRFITITERNYYHLFLFFIVILFIANGSFAQETIKKQGWSDNKKTSSAKEQTMVTKGGQLTLDVEVFSAVLKKIKKSTRAKLSKDNSIMFLPFPDGSFQRFSVIESPILSENLARKFPQIKTYYGEGIDDATATLRFDFTPAGFHGMVISATKTIYIDPISKGSNQYISYNKKDFVKEKATFQELAPRQNITKQFSSSKSKTAARSSGAELRIYKTAIAATGEYTIFHGGKKEDALAAIATTMNRVNGIYERELSVRMVLVGNNDLILYTNATTDPYSNTNAHLLLDENQTNLDLVIGADNYDIGHVFGTSAEGLAGIGVVCNANSKAHGTTGISSPIGDPFDVDYVAHEIGHQFGATHSFNGSSGACDNGRISVAAYEPGSGTTIMAYAGICFSQNIQPNSSDYFHAISYSQMNNHITAGGGCASITATGNNPPSVDAGGDRPTIPINTPFLLEGAASDTEDDELTYCWEQFDKGPQGNPNVPQTTAPIFRSFPPSVDSERSFPQLSDILGNTQTMGEILPSYTRELNFRLTVRDSKGGVDFDQIKFDVTDKAGPFVVSSFNTMETVYTETPENITWNVANTDMTPVNVAKVNILLSIDGGQTFSIMLAEKVPNDGFETVIIPNNPTTTARIKVEAVDNIFFDISDVNFTIEIPVTPDFVINIAPESKNICLPINESFEINTTSVVGFNTPITFSVDNLPTGMIADFSTNPLNPGENTSITLTNTEDFVVGNYDLLLSATSSGITKANNIKVKVLSDTPFSIVLSEPANERTEVSDTPLLKWIGDHEADRYDIDIATDAGFNTIIESALGIKITEYRVKERLTRNTTYFWRVRGIDFCGEGDYSNPFSFTTDDITYFTYHSTKAPISISDEIVTITDTIEITDDIEISDLNILDLTGTHDYVSDLEITLTSPNNTKMVLFRKICGNEDDFSLSFDDEATSNLIPCPATDGKTYKPQGLLSSFDAETTKGKWVLTVIDSFVGDGGSLDGWGIEICAKNAPPLAPKNLAANPISIDEISLTWEVGNDNHENFVVEQSKGGENNFMAIANLEKDIANYTAIFLEENVSYAFRVKATNANGESDYSNEVEVTTLFVGIENNELEGAVKLYPVPAKEALKINISNEELGAYTFQLIDLNGRVISRKTAEKNKRDMLFSFPLDNISKGVYIMEISSLKGIVREKLFKE